jgi:tight adherence protein C
MNHFLLFAYLFGAVMTGTVAAGYYLVLRPAEEEEQPHLFAGNNEQSVTQALAETLRAIGLALPGTVKPDQALRKLLIRAGYRSPDAPAVFNGITFATAAFLSLVFGGYMLLAQSSLSGALAPAICGFGLGYMLPGRVLRMRIKSRMRRLEAGLPTAMDLLVLSAEAGQALDQSISDAGREIRRPYPDLAEELSAVHLGLRASRSREEVFREFAERNNDPEIRKLANIFIDSDRFGSSLGPTLRTHARYLRIRRRQGAQEAARKITVKLVFPVFFLIFPAVLLVTLGPAAMQIMQSFDALTK